MTESSPFQEVYMRRAIELAGRALGKTHPNPMVGAVLVEDGVVVAEGWHRSAGQAHAEIEALQALGRRPKSGAALYVTLEPCSTEGRTGACTRAIGEAGIKRVVVGAMDPNPVHAGAGLKLLREMGVEVIDGILAEECSDLNLIFDHMIVAGSPMIAMKIATTLDGKFAAASGQSKWVTGERARKDVMRWRRYFPAIAVSANTVIADDPSLTSRMEGEPDWCPQRLILDRELRTVSEELAYRVYNDDDKARTIVLHAQDADESKIASLEAHGIVHWPLPLKCGHLDWQAIKTNCVLAGLNGVYVEPGPQLATALLESREVDYVFAYVAPKFLLDTEAPTVGSARNTRVMNDAINLNCPRHVSFGPDFLVRGWLAS